MKKIYTLIIIAIIVFTGQIVEGQTTVITGTVIDKTNSSTLPTAAVAIKTKGDTVITSAVTDMNGFFTIKIRNRNNVVLVVDYLGYKPYKKNIVINNQPKINLDKIRMTPSSFDIQEITVTDNAPPVKIKGDTTEFNASSYKTEPNAAAEDLVNKMPGVQVTEGKVTAQNEEIKRVVVDGKPFFGDDPTLALKNIPAEMIDKVQIIDDLSEQSKFSGFDDGERVKTMNIVTKKNRRKGMFGKLVMGYGGENSQTPQDYDRYNVNGSFSYFDGDTRVSLIGMTNNLNQLNFSMQDILGVMGQNTQMQGAGGRGGGGQGGGQGGGVLMRSMAQNVSASAGTGLNATNSLGVNYTDVWLKKISVTGSYFFNENTNNNTQDAIQNSLLTNQEYDQISTSHAVNRNHRINLRLDWDIDSVNSITFRPTMNIQQNNSNSFSNGATLSSLKDTTNKFNGLTSSGNTGYSFSGELLYRHRFLKPGRTFSIDIISTATNKHTNNSNNSLTTYYNTATTMHPADTLQNPVNQISSATLPAFTFSTNVSYTEPVTTKSILLFSIGYKVNPNSSDKNTDSLNKLTQQYDLIIPNQSSKFNNLLQAYKGGVSYKYIFTPKWQLTAGINYQTAFLTNDQTYPNANNVDKTFENWLPTFQLRYKGDKRNAFEFNYYTSTNQPSVTQLESVVNNDNPLNVSMGNPNLKQEYVNTINSRLMFLNPANQHSWMFLLNGSITNDRIANSVRGVTKDSTIAGIVPIGKDAFFSIPENMKDPYINLRGFVTYSFPVFHQKLNINLNSGLTYTVDPGMYNTVSNTTKTETLIEGIVFASNISQNIDFTLSGFYNYSNAVNSIVNSYSGTYSTTTVNAKFNYIFWQGLIFATSVNYSNTVGLTSGFNKPVTLWNMGFGKQLFANKAGEIRVTFYDLLNANTSVARNVTQTAVDDTRNLALPRYFLVTFTYNLRKFSGGASQGDFRNPNRPHRDDDHN